MSKGFSMGSKREGAKEIEIKVTKGKVITFLLIVVLILFGLTQVLKDDIKELYGSEFKVKCLNGSFEEIKQGVEYYCGEHYTTLNETTNFNDIKEVVEG